MNNNSTAHLTVDTPENVAFGYELAGMGVRFFAALIDQLTLLLLLFASLLAIGYAASFTELFTDTAPSWITAILILLIFIFSQGYFMVFELLWNGQTPGKRRLNIRTIRANGLPIDLTSSAIRNIMRLIDSQPVFFYGVGIYSVFFSLQARRLGDYAAGTLVVYDKPMALEQLEQAKINITSKGNGAEFPVERLTATDITLIEQYYARREALRHTPTLLRPIIDHLHNRMNIPLAEKLSYDEALNEIETILAKRYQPEPSSDRSILW